MERNMKRSITSAIVAGALLVGVACSGGGGVTPATKVDVPTVSGKSPGTFKISPMIKTAILPASAMTSRTPSSTIVPQSWSQIPGTASQVTAGADGSIWVLSDQPAGPDKNIWHYSGGSWSNVGGLAAQIAVGPDGKLWAANSNGNVFFYTGGVWTGIGGGAGALAPLADGSLVVSSATGGAAGNHALWHYSGGTWTQLPGSGASVYASVDAGARTLPGGTLQPGGFFIVNGAGNIYYQNPDTSFVQIPAQASGLASATGGLFGFGYPANAGGNSIYYYDLDAPATGWVAETGAGLSFSQNLNTLYVIATNDGIFQTAIETPSPSPTASATPTASPTATPTPVPLIVNPNPISLLQSGASTVSVTEAGFSGSITAVSGDTNILTATSPATMTAGAATVNINAVTSGSTTLTVSDGTQTVIVPVHVTITGVVINKAGKH
jgi:hypothetical protein